MAKKMILVIAIIISTATLFAEGNKTNAAKPNNTQSATLTDTAFKLLEEMNIKQVYNNAVNSSTQRIVNANPAFKPVEGKIKDFYNKYIGWNAVKDDLAKLYAKYYTKSELEDIVNFYKTKTGQKVLATMGKLSYETQMLTQKKLRPHLKDLKAILDDAIKKAQDSQTKSDTNSTKESKK